MGPAAENPDAARAEELAAVVREVRERVRARHPQGSGAGVALPDLMPLVHARDAAEGKVAAIGSVNPRPGGPLNSLIQAVKRLIARALDWHVREQVEFNRGAMACVEATLEAMNETNRALAELGVQIAELRRSQAEALGGTERRLDGVIARSADIERQFDDIRRHWVEWRGGWEHKLADNEIRLLRSVAELQAAFQHRAALTESNFRDTVRTQHAEFTAALENSGKAVEQRFWSEMEKLRLEYERMIHQELRLVRQRARALPAAPAQPAAVEPPAADLLAFGLRFRGTEDYVREKQRFYLPYFAGRKDVLDVGCGRGEFLELMREAGVAARGIDLDEEAVSLCRSRGLEAEQADLFAYLDAAPEAAFDGIFCAQVVEHLPPARVPEFVRLAASRLVRGGVLAIETPNPECLAIFATHFYLDPTHTRPVPHPLLAFYLEEAGMGSLELHRLSPAAESMPALAALPAEFRDAFFGGLDYALISRRL